MTLYVEHITSDGERWDQLALRYYGDASAYEPIIVANAHVPIRPTLEAGVRLRVPVRTVAIAPKTKLPPWVRS